MLHTLKDSDFRAAMQEAWNQSNALVEDRAGGVGYGVAALYHLNGTAEFQPFANLITDAGDLYQATKIGVGIGSGGIAAPTAVNGMKLAIGTTAVGKTAAGAASNTGTFITGSNVAFDSGFPAIVNLGAGLGVNLQYKTTWGPGVATSATINEAAIVNDQATAANASVANTISRTVLTTVNKGASDTFALTWNHKQLGS